MTKRMLALGLSLLLCLGMTPALAQEGTYHRFEDGLTLRIARNDGFAFYGYNEEWTTPETSKWVKVVKDTLNVDFEYAWLTTQDPDSYNTKWNLAIASGDMPTAAGVSRMTYESLVEAGLVADMGAFYEQYASDRIKGLVEGSPEKDYMTRDGALLGYPDVRPSMDAYDVLVVRKDWMDAVGVETIPTTIEGVLDLGKQFVEAGLGGEHTYALGTSSANGRSGWGTLMGFFQGYGIPYANGYWALNEDKDELYYGRTDERMKDALLQLQDLYNKGLIKEDYLVTSVNESFTAGEVGIMYSICYGPVNAVDLYALDGKLELVSSDIPTLDGAQPQYYVNAVPGVFIFVSNKATDDEKLAVVEIMNLCQDLFMSFDYDWGYHRGGFPFTPGDQMESAFQYAKYYDEIEHAYTTGDLDSFLTANGKTYYTRLMNFEAGDRSLGKYHGIYRVPNGTYNVINTAMKEDRVHNSAYLSAPTENMLEYQSLLDELLTNAENQVIMGADISVWEKAVQEWYATGGQDMTDDANQWYKAQ